jgi:lysophospholipase L1-like esterase
MRLLRSIGVLICIATVNASAQTTRPATAPTQIDPSLPTLFLIGDSTVRNGTQGQAGWGEVVGRYFDKSEVNLVNRAIGGRSSRTFITEGRWDRVLAEMKSGDFVIIQFGHNDGGEIARGNRPRGSLRGIGEESEDVVVEMTGQKETVHTFGWYLRKYINDAKAKGVTPIVCSYVARKIWKDERIERGTYAAWAREVAQAEKVPLLDLNEITAREYEKLGAEKVQDLFADERTHTNRDGAEVNARCAVAGLKAIDGLALRLLMSDETKSIEPYTPANHEHANQP